MKYELNTNLVPLFSGTYETWWDVSETDDEGEELEVEYDQQELMKSIAQVYAKKEKYILSEFNCPFLRSIHFTGKTFSPREYNFKTDELDFVADVNESKLRETLAGLKDNKDFATFLHDNYTSYDGFWSFTPNNYAGIVEALTKPTDEHGLQQQTCHHDQALSAVITYLAKNNIKQHGGVSIEEMLHEDWEGNGYSGLDYKIVTA